MAVSTLSKGTILTTAAEQNLLSTAEQTPGIYVLVVDANAMTGTDVIVLRLKEKVTIGGTSRVRRKLTTPAGAQDPAVLELGPIEITYELQATIQRTAGTDRSFDWELRRIG